MMKQFIILGATFMLTACISGTSTPATFYTLTKPTSETPPISKTYRKDITIDRVKIPAYLDKPQIVLMHPNKIELDISETHRWAEPLTTLMQRTIQTNIATLLPTAMVRNKNMTQGASDYTILLAVNRLDGHLNGPLDFEIWWAIQNKNNRIVKQKTTLLSGISGTTYHQFIIELNGLIFDLSHQIAQEIIKEP